MRDRKRLIKTPKRYFYGVGLAAHLLGITTAVAQTRDPVLVYGGDRTFTHLGTRVTGFHELSKQLRERGQCHLNRHMERGILSARGFSMSIDELPQRFRNDLTHAIEILKGFGAREVYVFGSIRRNADPDTVHDIDFAVAGLPPESFFEAYGTLMMRLEHSFDLVDIADNTAFVKALKESGSLERVA